MLATLSASCGRAPHKETATIDSVVSSERRQPLDQASISNAPPSLRVATDEEKESVTLDATFEDATLHDPNIVPASTRRELSDGESAGESEYDGERAFAILEHLCRIGRRVSNSPGMAQQQAFLTDHFQRLGAIVTRQEFTAPHPVHRTPVPMTNLIVSWHPESHERVVLCAHYDTRPFPDQDPDPRGRRGEFIGANDGASGVACLAELGRHLRPWQGRYGVDFVLFDGEEFVFRRGDKYFHGSEHFARQYVAQPPNHTYRWGILLDMVADAELHLYQEKNSVSWPDTRPLVASIWRTAAEMGIREFIPKPEYAVQDDHLALRNIARIPTCDLIDFYYPRPGVNYWHTRADLPENCSADSLRKVGSVILRWLRTAGQITQ